MTIQNRPWITKYSPKSVKEIVNHEDVVKKIIEYLSKYKRGKKPLLFGGATGVGKTAIVYAVANDLNYEVVEVNASDTRNKEEIHRIVGSATTQGSLFFRKRLVLIDEIDGIAGKEDYGGVAELVNIVKDSPNPIILIANNIYNEKINPLRKMSEIVEVGAVPYKDIIKVLKKIAKSEGLNVEESVFERISASVNGDLRAAINDLQTISSGKKITEAELEMLGLREKEENIIQAMTKVLKTRDISISLGSFDRVKEEVEEIMMWLDENVAKEYKKIEDVAKVYNELSIADVFFGRIRRWQHYRYYVYIYALLTAGISLAKNEKYVGFTQYKKPSRPLTIWIMNRANAARKSFAKKLALYTHSSIKRAYKEVIIFKVACKSNKNFLKELSEQLGLDEVEKGWLSE